MTGYVQSSRFLPWRKREDEFATAFLPCQSLAGEVRPMQTQCSHAVVSYKVKVAQWKSFMSKLCVLLSERKRLIFAQK